MYAPADPTHARRKPVPSGQPSPKPKKAPAEEDYDLPEDSAVPEPSTKLRSLITQVTSKENARKQTLTPPTKA